MSVEENDLRKDLEAAFEQHAEEPEHQEAGRSSADTPEPMGSPPAAEGAEAVATEGAAEASADSGRDEKGRFKGKEPGPGTEPAAAKPEGATKTDPAAEKPPEGQQPEVIPPPAGLKAAAREHWAKVPRPVQEEIVRREKETAQTLRQSAQARQMAQEFQSVVNPFLPMIQSQGSNPMQAVKNLMTTAAGLTVGTQVQKAQIVREIIQNYGIDVATLDQVLSGQPLQQQQGAPQQQSQLAPPPWASPIFQFMNSVQQQRQQREQQILSEAEAETEAFAEKNEFFEDVRETMADIMELGAKRGKIISMEDAYKQAIGFDPELSKIVSQREAAKKSQTQQQNMQRTRNAASSIAGGPKGGPAGNSGGDDSRRSALSEAWDAQMGR